MFIMIMVSSCADDANEIEIREDGKIHVNVGAEMENTVEMTTRTASGYDDFSGDDYNGWTMGVIAHTTVTSNGSDTDIIDNGSATYSYSGSTGSWASALWLGPADYNFYSYMPSSLNAKLDDTNRKHMVISDLAPFGTTDVLACVGSAPAKTTIADGNYKVTISTDSEFDNKVIFRMNHLLAKLKLNFQLPEGKYDDLRKIEITNVTLGSDIENSKNYTATCDYSGAMTCSFTPAAAYSNETASVSFAYNGTNGTSLSDNKQKVLTLPAENNAAVLYDFDASNGEIFVIPDVINKNNKHLKLTITYNIFTKDSTTDEYVETRHQVTATNSSLVVYKKDGVATDIEAAKVYTLTVKVIPTYLYVLADVDQSNSIVLK